MTYRLDRPLPGPMNGGSWAECDMAGLVAAYCLSGDPSGDGRGTASLGVRVDGRLQATGGDPRLLAVIKQRRDEAAEFLAMPCAGCRRSPGEFWTGLLGPSPKRLCGVCFFDEAEALRTDATAPEAGSKMDRSAA